MKCRPVAENKSEDVKATKSVSEYVSMPGLMLLLLFINFQHAIQLIYFLRLKPDELEWDEFGNDLYAMPKVAVAHSSNPVQCDPLPAKADKDSKIKALYDTPALDWQW